MPTYGYIRTSRDQEPGHPGSDPHVQRRQLVEAGVDSAQICADVATPGAKDYNSRDQWHVLDQQLVQGDDLDGQPGAVGGKWPEGRWLSPTPYFRSRMAFSISACRRRC